VDHTFQTYVVQGSTILIKVTQANTHYLPSIYLGGGLTTYFRDMPKLKLLTFMKEPVSREKS